MTVRDKEQLEISPNAAWHNRRIQRCLISAVILVIILCASLYRRHQWPTITELHLDTLTGLHKYTSSPDAGRPSLPFNNDPARKTSEEPFFEISEDAWEIPTTYEVKKVPIDPSLVALDPTRVALLIETRALPHLPALLLHFISVLPLAWTFRFLGSPESIALIESSKALYNFIETGKLLVSDLPAKYPVNSQESLSATLTDLSFYSEALAPAEWLLVFQADSMVCAGSSQSLDDWVDKEYTWVGAPWHIGNEYGGNGGLSLRHLPPIISMLEEIQREPGSGFWEDRWLCDNLWLRDDTNMPPPEITKEFSVESVWTEKPFGYHLRGSGKLLSREVWGEEEKIEMIYDYCPEIKIVLDMERSETE